MFVQAKQRELNGVARLFRSLHQHPAQRSSAWREARSKRRPLLSTLYLHSDRRTYIGRNHTGLDDVNDRSEERRVGKEC